jgi:hypothetical protein
VAAVGRPRTGADVADAQLSRSSGWLHCARHSWIWPSA